MPYNCKRHSIADHAQKTRHCKVSEMIQEQAKRHYLTIQQSENKLYTRSNKNLFQKYVLKLGCGGDGQGKTRTTQDAVVTTKYYTMLTAAPERWRPT